MQSLDTSAPSRPLLKDRRPSLYLRAALGGVLMGLANLVPGISGGTMLVAAGVYPHFVAAVAAVTSLRWRPAAWVMVGVVGGSAVVAIGLLAGIVKDLVIDHRWVMYSLFIGLTLGGLPVLWRLARPAPPRLWMGAAAGFLAMAALAIAQAVGAAGDAGTGFGMMFVAGLAGSAAMILPGVSGGYLLLLLGQYVPILSGIETLKDALSAGDLAAASGPLAGVVLPVSLGVVVGVAAVSNAVRWLLIRFEKITLGFLIGLLLGAVVGLWPFQQSVEPVVGETVVKGRVVTAERLAEIDPEDLPTEFFPPTAAQVAAALALALAGFAATSAIARLGRDPEAEESGEPELPAG